MCGTSEREHETGLAGRGPAAIGHQGRLDRAEQRLRSVARKSKPAPATTPALLALPSVVNERPASNR
jgi:hypothetical protein